MEADTLQPESVSSISIPAKEEITEDLLVSDEENHTLDKLLEDLNNLNVPSTTDLESKMRRRKKTTFFHFDFTKSFLDNDANTSSQ